jgi:hypothetical protein
VTDGIEAWNEPGARAYSRLDADHADLTTVIGVTDQSREAIDAHNAQVFENLFKKRPLLQDWVRSGNRGGVAAGRRVARHGDAQSGVDAAAVLRSRRAIPPVLR